MADFSSYNCTSRNSLGTARSEKFHQLQLGASEKGELIVLQRPPKNSIQGFSISDMPYKPSISEPPIITLPDELLDEIFSMAVACDHWRYDFYTCALALSKVCKLFHRIVQPLLFKNIQFGYSRGLAPASMAVRRLHRTIKENPELGILCKSARFYISSFPATLTPGYYVFGDELLSWLPNITSFELHGGFAVPPTWPFLRRAFQNMPHLKSLKLSRELYDLFLHPVCDVIIQMIQLQSLTLHGISAQKDHVIWAPSSKELERTSTITKLNISDFGETPEALQNLLRLPKALQHFRFGQIHSNRVDWNLSFFQWLLQDHQSSLKSIEISSLGRAMGCINFLDFPQLQTLNLSRWAFDLSPEVASSTLLAPKLHTFIWDFHIEAQHNVSWSAFGQENKEWIVKFAKLAAARKSALRTIKIIFDPDDSMGPDTRETLRDWVCPWELMDEARDAMRPCGVELVYTKGWTKQEFLARIIRDEEEKREAIDELDSD